MMLSSGRQVMSIRGKAPVPFVEMPLHGGNRIAHQAKGHVPIRGALMLDQHINIPGAGSGFHGPEEIGVAETKILFDKAARLQPQRRQITECA